MAEWGDDDDFGGFESADIGDVGSSPTVSSVMTSETSSHTIMASPKPDSDSAQVQILDWILSNTPKPQSEPTDVTSISQESMSSISQGEQLKDRLNDSSEVARTLDDKFSGSGDAATLSALASEVTVENAIQRSEEFTEAKKAITSVANDKPEIQKTIEDNSEALHKLQAELEAALIMKEQTEKSLEKLQEDLIELQEKSRKEMEESKEKHDKEMENLKTQHNDEISELQNTSKETISLVTKQYTEIWKLLEKEKACEVQSNANSIVEKCLELLQQQQDTLSKRLEDDRRKQEVELEETLKKEKENMETELKEKIEKEKVILEEELNKKLKEKMAEEATNLQELHTTTLREAMTTQQAHFENLLQTTLQSEREKFTETLKSAVKEAQENTEKLAEDKRKIEARRLKNHTMGLKMLLTSALQQVENNFSDDFDNVETEDS